MKKFSKAYIIPIIALLGLCTGAVLHFAGKENWDHLAWMIAMIVGIIPLLWKMFQDIRHGRFGVDIVAIVAIVTSFLLGEYLAGNVILLMLSGGEALEDYALHRARRELSHLISNAPTFAHIIKGEKIVDVSVGDVNVEDIILIKAGELVPADGVVIKGKSQIDEAAITGESLPVEKSTGSMVFSGSVNKGSVLEVRVLKHPSESKYEQIIKLIKQAEENRAPVVRLADRYSIWFTIVTFIIAAIAWFVSHDLIRVLAVLVVATPCPLILATPIAMISGISKAASRGIIVKSGGALEVLAESKAFIFDKTGTLTLGEPEVTEVIPLGASESEVFKLSASLDQLSVHILARSLKTEASKRNVNLLLPENFEEKFGDGVCGEIDGQKLFFGKLKFIQSQGVPVSEHVLKQHEIYQNTGKISVYLSDSKSILGAIIFADVVRPETKSVFAGLKESGIKNLVMLTGDKKQVAEVIAKDLNIDDIHAEALPEDKVFEVKDHQRQFGKVAMVGDGINDAPALIAADVGIALGGHGGSASSDSGDIVIMVDDISRVGEAYKIAKKVLGIAKEGIFFGIGASIILMIIASMGYIKPVYGALLQEAIDVVVILNALRVLFYKVK